MIREIEKMKRWVMGRKGNIVKEMEYRRWITGDQGTEGKRQNDNMMSSESEQGLCRKRGRVKKNDEYCMLNWTRRSVEILRCGSTACSGIHILKRVPALRWDDSWYCGKILQLLRKKSRADGLCWKVSGDGWNSPAFQRRCICWRLQRYLYMSRHPMGEMAEHA